VEDSYSKRNEVVRLENELVISEIVFGIVHGPYEGFQRNPSYPNSKYSSLEL
jgi:hypothetical protein